MKISRYDRNPSPLLIDTSADYASTSFSLPRLNHCRNSFRLDHCGSSDILPESDEQSSQEHCAKSLNVISEHSSEWLDEQGLNSQNIVQDRCAIPNLNISHESQKFAQSARYSVSVPQQNHDGSLVHCAQTNLNMSQAHCALPNLGLSQGHCGQKLFYCDQACFTQH